MDLDELLDGPNKAPSFAAPKGSKFKPKTKTEPSDSQPPPPLADPVESVPAPKEEELSVKPETKPEFSDNAIEMDVEVKPAVKDDVGGEEEDKDDLMETETEFVDEVVREIDIYFNPSVDSQTRVRLKPKRSQVEIDLTVDVDSKNYNHNADHTVEMKKQTLTTSWEPPHNSGYAVGYRSGNKLHLSPIHSVVQLRPSMQHLDPTMAPGNVRDNVKSEEPQERKPSSTNKLSKTSEQTEDIEESNKPTNNKPINNPTTSRISTTVASRTTKEATLRAAMPEEVREAITKALQKLFKYVKICSFQQIFQLLRDMAVSESSRSKGFAKELVIAACSIDDYPDELRAIINQVAVNINGICVPKSSPDNPLYDPFRKVVLNLLIAQAPNDKLKKASIYEAAKMELQREPTPVEYQKVLQELCTSQGGAWSLRNVGVNPL